MNVFEATIVKNVLEGGRQQRRTITRTFSFPSRPDEITMRRWVAFQIKKAAYPEIFVELELLPPDEQQVVMRGWDEAMWQQFLVACAECLATLSDATAAELIRALPAAPDGSTGLLSLFFQLGSMINTYQPRDIEATFQWKGVDYVWPQSAADNFGREWVGDTLNTMASIEALQVEHVLNAKDESGEYVMADRKYHVDIALIAIFARRLLPDGEIEEMPLDYAERQRWIERRSRIFEDAPMTLALDAAFFLTGSKSALARIHTLLTRLRPTLAPSSRPSA